MSSLMPKLYIIVSFYIMPVERAGGTKVGLCVGHKLVLIRLCWDIIKSKWKVKLKDRASFYSFSNEKPTYKVLLIGEKQH